MVAASAYLSASRSSSGMWRTASIASMFSLRLTGMPAARSSPMKPASSSSMGEVWGGAVSVMGRPPSRVVDGRSGRGELGAVARELLDGLVDVAAVLEEDVDRLGRVLLGDLVDVEQHQRVGPVEGLRHRRRLLQLELA